jgi:hypothetical protein
LVGGNVVVVVEVVVVVVVVVGLTQSKQFGQYEQET